MNPMPSAAYYPQQNTRMGPRSVSEEEFNVPRQVSTLTDRLGRKEAWRPTHFS